MMTQKMKPLFLSMMACLALSGCVTNHAPSTQILPQEAGDYTLGMGDTLRITVFGQENLTGEFVIEPNGSISMPLIKDVPASGMTAVELENSITQKLQPDYVLDPRVNVEVIKYRPTYVLGEVNTPGKYEYAPNMTVLQAVAMAGGYTYRGNEDTAEITRHVKGALKTFTVDQKTMVKPGDTIIIKRRWF